MKKTLKVAVVRTANKVGLALKKHSPTILTIGGIAAMVGACVFASKSTLKAHNVIEDHRARLEEVHRCMDLVAAGEIDTSEYTDKDYRKDLFGCYIKTGVEFIKLYAPAIIFTAAGIAMILTGHNILKKRNIALMSAYTALDTAFSDYRKRVKNELGEEADYRFRTGAEKVKMTDVTTDENGKVTKTEKDAYNIDPNKNVPSMYAKFFDESSPYWREDPQLNLAFLRSRQCEANERLFLKGHLTLNEVYEMLGIEETSYGALVGWMLNDEGHDGYVDFGIFDSRSKSARYFVNGEDPNILLDFNVDGIIYNKLKS